MAVAKLHQETNMALDAAEIRESVLKVRKPEDILSLCRTISEGKVKGSYEDNSRAWMHLRDKVFANRLGGTQVAHGALESLMKAREESEDKSKRAA